MPAFPSHRATLLPAILSVFAAKVYNDLYPDSRWRKWVWVGALAVPAATAWYRYRAGKHFPTDVTVGYAIGAGLAWLVPTLHKRKNSALSLGLVPVQNGMTLSLRARLGNRQAQAARSTTRRSATQYNKTSQP